MARNGCKIAKRKNCLLFKFPVFRWANFNFNDTNITVGSCEHQLCLDDSATVAMDLISGKWVLKNNRQRPNYAPNGAEFVCETTVS